MVRAPRSSTTTPSATSSVIINQTDIVIPPRSTSTAPETFNQATVASDQSPASTTPATTSTSLDHIEDVVIPPFVSTSSGEVG